MDIRHSKSDIKYQASQLGHQTSDIDHQSRDPPIHQSSILVHIYIYIYIYIYPSGFDKRYLQKIQVRFNNLTFEVNKKQLKVSS